MVDYSRCPDCNYFWESCPCCSESFCPACRQIESQAVYDEEGETE